MLIFILLVAEVLLSGAGFVGLCSAELVARQRRMGEARPAPRLLIHLLMIFGAACLLTAVAATALISPDTFC